MADQICVGIEGFKDTILNKYNSFGNREYMIIIIQSIKVQRKKIKNYKYNTKKKKTIQALVSVRDHPRKDTLVTIRRS